MDWYYAEAGQQKGPVSESEFDNLVRSGAVRDETLVWREGMSNWLPYRDVRAPQPVVPGAPSPIPSSPAASAGYGGGDARRVALEKVNGPAIGLIVTACLGILMGLTTLAVTMGGFNFMPPNAAGDPNIERMMQMMSGGVGILNVVLIAALSALTFVAGVKMRKLQGYGLAIAGSIVALIPCTSPCCVLGLPIGIWALVVLNKPEVKSQFT